MLPPHDPVQASIIHALDNYCYEDAVFLGERLFAEAPTDSTLFLLANCYYQSGRKCQAYKFFRNKGYPTARCKYLYSKCCFDMGKLGEAEFVLTDGATSKSKVLDDFVSEYGDIASFAISLLADIYRKTERHVQALEWYQNSLILNPFLWSSFSKMCRMGAKPDSSKVFHSNHVPEALSSVKSVLFSPQVPQQVPPQSWQHAISQQRVSNATSTPMLNMSTPLISVTSPSSELLESRSEYDTPRTVADKSSLQVADSLFTPEAPSFGVTLLETPIAATYNLTTPNMMSPPISRLDAPKAPIKKMTKCQPAQPQRPLPANKLVFGQSSTSNTKNDVMPPPSGRQSVSSILPRRRSKRILDSQNSSSVKENNKVQTRSKHLSPRLSVRKPRSTQSVKTCHDDLNCKNKLICGDEDDEKPATISSSLEVLDSRQKQSAGAFLSLLRDLGSAYSASQSYDMRTAISRFEAISHRQYNTGWVLSEVGRAHLELSDYSKAEAVFEQLRKQEPHQERGMETYSTVLFHLQKEVALSSLSQEMVNMDKLCPETWCVAGNCFSLQKEHETAIKFLQRAIQVDEEFAYAYTLLGHEYTLTEDYEKAMSAFRSALRADSRHYNAWYGLGMIYYKKEKFSLAETHFKKALSINPENAVLLCHIGLVQHALQRHGVALETLNRAVALAPNNPMCLFHHASMLVANDRLDDALQELESLKVITPKESLVYFLIGKVHKKLGNAHLSMLNFSWATDLDPKGANNHIKEAIDRRYVTDDDDDDDDSMSPSIDASILMGRTPDGHLSTDTSILMDSDEVHHLQAAESDDSL